MTFQHLVISPMVNPPVRWPSLEAILNELRQSHHSHAFLWQSKCYRSTDHQLTEEIPGAHEPSALFFFQEEKAYPFCTEHVWKHDDYKNWF